jgi:hypothetical protein
MAGDQLPARIEAIEIRYSDTTKLTKIAHRSPKLATWCPSSRALRQCNIGQLIRSSTKGDKTDRLNSISDEPPSSAHPAHEACCGAL